MESNKKFQAFIAVCVVAVIIGGLSIKFRGAKEDTDEMTCHINLRKLEGIIDFIKTEGGNLPVGLIAGDLRERFEQQLQNESFPGCPNGGELRATVSGRAICSIHGTDDNLVVTDADFEYTPPEPAELIEEVEVYAPPPEAQEMPELEKLMAEARNAFYERRMEDAIPLLIQASQVDDKRLDVLFLLASCYEKATMYQEARDTYGRILTIDPENAVARKAANDISNREYFALRLANRYERGWSVMFLSWTGDYGRDAIYMMNVDGSSTKQILANKKGAIFQIFPGENRLFIAENATIYETDFTGQNQRNIYDNNKFPISAFALSPDGENIAFTSQRTSRYHELYIMKMSSEEALKVTDAKGNCADIGWSHHGREVIFTEYRSDKESDIYVARLSGRGGVVALTKDGMLNSHPDWSHNRSYIVYCSRTGGEADTTTEDFYAPPTRGLWSMSGMGSNRKKIISDPSIDMAWPKLSPTGNQIAFIGSKKGVAEIYVVNTNGSGLRKLTNFNQKTGSSWSYGAKIEWFPDETLLYFSAGSANKRNIYLLEVGSGRHTVVYESETNDDYATLIHPGRKKFERRKIRPLK